MRLSSRVAILALSLAALAGGPATAQTQGGDPDYRPVVARPAYAAQGPLIALDAAHRSDQTLDDRYAGFGALARADGYRIEPLTRTFDQPGALDGVSILVIANPASPRDGSSASAFTEGEIDAVDAWVRAGGSLLLAVDHAPHGAAAEALGQRFGVDMGKGYAFQISPRTGAPSTQMGFPEPALGDHPILRGRDADERVRTVFAYTGQSLKGPPGSTVLAAMSDDAWEAPDLPALDAIADRLEAGEPADVVLPSAARPLSGRAQSVAFTHGEGRVVVLGEAGMLTAQRIRFPDASGRPDMRFGLQDDGHDDQQFALNILHWLSGLLP